MPSVGDRPARRLARQTLAEIVEPRYEELFGLIREELRRCGFEEVIAAGIVITGGSAKWRAPSNSRRKSSTCRCGSAFRNS